MLRFAMFAMRIIDTASASMVDVQRTGNRIITWLTLFLCSQVDSVLIVVRDRPTPVVTRA